MSNGKFTLFNGQDSQFYFNLKAPNGEIIGASEGYTQKHNAINGIESVRVHSQTDNNFTVWQSQNDSQWYFHLKASNGEIILSSEGYTSKQNSLHGAGAVKAYAPDAELVDSSQSQAA